MTQKYVETLKKAINMDIFINIEQIVKNLKTGGNPTLLDNIHIQIKSIPENSIEIDSCEDFLITPDFKLLVIRNKNNKYSIYWGQNFLLKKYIIKKNISEQHFIDTLEKLNIATLNAKQDALEIVSILSNSQKIHFLNSTNVALPVVNLSNNEKIIINMVNRLEKKENMYKSLLFLRWMWAMNIKCNFYEAYEASFIK